MLLDATGTVNAAGTAYPSITPGHGAGELYFGYALNSGSASSGSTSGYTYNPNVDGINDGLCFNPSCTSATQAPAWADSNTKSGIAVLLYEAGQSPGALLVPPSPFTPMNFRRRAVPSTAPPLVTAPEAGLGADTASVAASVSDTDTGSGAEAASAHLGASDADTGHGADTGTVASASISGAETGSGADTGGAVVNVSGADTGSGAEGSSVSVRPLLLVRWNAPDKISRSGGTIHP